MEFGFAGCGRRCRWVRASYSPFWIGFGESFSGNDDPSSRRGGGRGRLEFQLPCEVQSLLGMSIEGFEEEILYLLKRMEGIIEQKSKKDVYRKTKSSTSKAKRELKKLEWTVSYKRTIVVTFTGTSGGVSGLGCK